MLVAALAGSLLAEVHWSISWSLHGVRSHTIVGIRGHREQWTAGRCPCPCLLCLPFSWVKMYAVLPKHHHAGCSRRRDSRESPKFRNVGRPSPGVLTWMWHEERAGAWDPAAHCSSPSPGSTAVLAVVALRRLVLAVLTVRAAREPVASCIPVILHGHTLKSNI